METDTGLGILIKDVKSPELQEVSDQTTQSTVYGGNVLLKAQSDAVFLDKIKGQFWCIVRNC